jgi:DNA-binding Xre family transcriptional regulator
MRGIDMAVSYKKLFKLLIDRDMKKKDFKELTGISQGTLNKLQNGGNVMVDVLEKICLNMDCNIEDIMEIYPDPVDSTKKRTARSVQ